MRDAEVRSLRVRRQLRRLSGGALAGTIAAHVRCRTACPESLVELFSEVRGCPLLGPVPRPRPPRPVVCFGWGRERLPGMSGTRAAPPSVAGTTLTHRRQYWARWQHRRNRWHAIEGVRVHARAADVQSREERAKTDAHRPHNVSASARVCASQLRGARKVARLATFHRTRRPLRISRCKMPSMTAVAQACPCGVWGVLTVSG